MELSVSLSEHKRADVTSLSWQNVNLWVLAGVSLASSANLLPGYERLICRTVLERFQRPGQY